MGPKAQRRLRGCAGQVRMSLDQPRPQGPEPGREERGQTCGYGNPLKAHLDMQDTWKPTVAFQVKLEWTLGLPPKRLCGLTRHLPSGSSIWGCQELLLCNGSQRAKAPSKQTPTSLILDSILEEEADYFWEVFQLSPK